MVLNCLIPFSGGVPTPVLPGADPVPWPGLDPGVLHATRPGLLRGLQHSPPHSILAALQLPGGRPHLCTGELFSIFTSLQFDCGVSLLECT